MEVQQSLCLGEAGRGRPDPSVVVIMVVRVIGNLLSKGGDQTRDEFLPLPV